MKTEDLTELYHKYKTRVLNMSPAVQHYRGNRLLRENTSLSDGEIAQRLGLEKEQVTQIRCRAEVEYLPLSAWPESEAWKMDKAARAAGRGNKNG